MTKTRRFDSNKGFFFEFYSMKYISYHYIFVFPYKWRNRHITVLYTVYVTQEREGKKKRETNVSYIYYNFELTLFTTLRLIRKKKKIE